MEGHTGGHIKRPAGYTEGHMTEHTEGYRKGHTEGHTEVLLKGHTHEGRHTHIRGRHMGGNILMRKTCKQLLMPR